MKYLGRRYLILLIGVWLVACGQTPPPTATPIFNNPPPTPPPTATSIIIPTPPLLLEPFQAEGWEFTIDLPAHWAVSDPVQIPLGRLYQVGEEPLGPGPFSSTLIVADATVWSPTEAARILKCGDGCEDRIFLTTVVVGEANTPIDAFSIIIGEDTPTPLEWFFVPHQEQLVIFTLHDPTTLETLPDVFASFNGNLETATPTPDIPTPTAISAPTETAAASPSVTTTSTTTSTPLSTSTTSPASTITASPTQSSTQTNTPTPTQTATATSTATATPETGVTTTPVELPIDYTIAFLQSLAADSTGNSSLIFLSQLLRENIRTGQQLLEYMSLDRRFTNFGVAWASNQNGAITYQTTLEFGGSRPSETRLITLIFEDEAWRVSGVE